MPDEESKPAEQAAGEPQAQVEEKQAIPQSESDDDDAPVAATEGAAGGQSGPSKKKKKKPKKASATQGSESASTAETTVDFVERAFRSLSPQQLQEFLSLNPALRQEVDPSGTGEDVDIQKITERVKNMNIGDILTGLAAGGKNAKDMASYHFWQTQPVPRFGEDDHNVEEGPLKIQTVDEISKEPGPMLSSFKWVTMDLTDDEHIKEVYELLNGHYVEDDEAMFRFNYTAGILKWAMMAPGWDRKFHVGVRAKDSQKLVAFISAVPIDVRVRGNVFKSSEVNFLCVHKKLRGKRLAPVLIKEITRISNLEGIWQGLFTAGIVLPKPVSTCRYYHRPLNWQKLYECNFVHLPANSKPLYQIRKYALPDNTSTKGLRVMKPGDIDGVLSLMDRFMAKYDIAPKMNKEEATHWFTPTVDPKDNQFIWSYVVEDQDKKITDYFSFYCIESSAINNPKHKIIRVAYLFYYATEVGLNESASREDVKTRINGLINDALVIAKKAKFDVFNALSLMDNGLFLEQQKFGPGDGQLHYYLFNYRANPIYGGIRSKLELDEENLSGVGFVLP